jgi:hypothetical protein
MSAQGPVPPATAPRATLRLVAALLLGVAIGAAGALLVTARATDASRRRETARALSPDRSKLAIAEEMRCGDGVCVELRLGPSGGATSIVGSPGSRSCVEIVWTPDGARVGYVIDGSEITIYDAKTMKLAGTVRLLTAEAAQTRVARGITFSENGRAATFDDCPRAHSGCRAGVVGVPQ